MTIEIIHTRSDGTLIHGTSKGDGAAEVLKTRDYSSGYTQPARHSRTLGCWYLPNSRDKRALKTMLEALAERLRAAGFTVTVTIREADRRTFADAEQERVERAEDRAERFAGYADNASTRSDAAWARVGRIAEGIPFGQPILVGHHSERRARRDQERMDTAARTSFAESKRAGYWSGRQQAAEAYERHRTNPGRTLRRLDKLRADLRAVEKWQHGQSAKGYRLDPTNPEVSAELTIRHDELTEEITYWEEVIAQAEANGFKVWAPQDFKRGEYARYGGTWYEVLRVNPKSVTIPHIHNGVGRKVVRATDAANGWTWTLPYHEVSGRMTADELAQKFTAAP
ncbi:MULTISPECIES: DUF3560 domain-containing protein [Streptacidiphilus]|uniref:DUF3560 domain-containing protein n=1 Tax=Streptacidiphilus cavernicola TaxID=3342716 RepID=A0ABV6UP26_9ACTN|nr:DUF3560 domain-containing protein [Streptacidiphilus jeojiense]